MQYLFSSLLLSKFQEITQGTSNKFLGPSSFTYTKNENQLIIDRIRFLDALELDPTHSILVCEQNHTSNIVEVTQDLIQNRLGDESSQIANTDGLITQIPNINLVVYTADCMPVSFYDPVKKVIGIAHSGWRGTIQDISKNMLKIFQEKYGCSIRDIRVSIGPSIGPCCYEVNHSEQLSLFEQRYHNNITREGKTYVDLWNSIEQDMLGAGILIEHLENPRICTVCHHDIYASHRHDHPNTTVNLTFISMKT